MSVTREEADAKLAEIQGMLLDAMAKRGRMTVAYGFSRPPTVADLAIVEKAISAWIRDTVVWLANASGQKLPKGFGRAFKFSIPLDSVKQIDDGKDELRIVLDFGHLFGEKPKAVKP